MRAAQRARETLNFPGGTKETLDIHVYTLMKGGKIYARLDFANTTETNLRERCIGMARKI